jgi:DNA-binding NarL/FixJ family response regulator
MRVLGIVAPSATMVGRASFAAADIARGSARPVKPAKQKHNRTWSEKDEGILQKMLADGESIDTIAVKLKRTRQAVGARASRLHLKWGKAKS